MNPILNRNGRTPSHRRGGFVLPTVLFAMVVLMTITTVSLRSAMDERSAARAMRESGAALAAGRGGIELALSDGDPRRTSADETDHIAFPVKARQSSIDSVGALLSEGQTYDFGWETGPDGSSFRAVLRRCDDGSDPAYVLTVNANAGGTSGPTRTQQLFLTAGAAVSNPEGIVVDGDMKIDGQVWLGGNCVSVQANGAMRLAGLLVTDAEVQATGTLDGGGTVCQPMTTYTSPTYNTSLSAGMISDADVTRTYETTVSTADCDPYAPAPTLTANATPVAVPSHNAMDYCGEADFFLRNGWVVEAGTLDSIDVTGSLRSHGWRYSLDSYRTISSSVSAGTVCADGNVKVAHDLGSSASPLPLTILAAGSVEISVASTASYLVSDHSSGAAIIAGGDVSLTGDLIFLAANDRALIYAGSQCQLSGGQMLIAGQLICKDALNPIFSEDSVAENKITSDGMIRFRFACVTAVSGPGNLRPISQRAWREVW